MTGDEFSRRRSRLLSRIQRRYQTLTQRLEFGPLAFDFTRIANPNRVLDEACDAEDRRSAAGNGKSQSTLPYWAELWESSAALVRELIDIGPLRGRRVLDLGCGMGLAGTAAAMLGANVLFADLEAPSLLFARLNSLDFSERIRTRVVNWESENLGEKFDMILGSDILYERRQWESLTRFWKTHLADTGSILLAEPRRSTADLFPDWIVRQGWAIEIRWQNAGPKPIRIFQLRMKEILATDINQMHTDKCKDKK